ncbi:MAG: hypothetical protein CM15mP86_07920 [Gammaproteobacteria bacterium]|nr:MAG: hypothetical protein CM15mP86_07920 [Gammaproteobacteria bacterium]
MLAADTVGAAQVMLDKSVAYSLREKQFEDSLVLISSSKTYVC